MDQHLLELGILLVILGLVTGLLVPRFTNPRMGVASHLQGMTNGPLLMVLGLTWPRLHLSHGWLVVTFWLAVYGAYANWLATQVAAVWGAGHRFAPGASGDHRSTPGRERVVDVLLATLAPAILAACVLVLIGLLR
ncbi:Hydroxylaminobenzene mutase [Nostocoides japonicum T1-X7]|uniref:Hydroxylaminobenzene mutase n=1 Tax=Nostocoides japonicum T1-X7 TaxID=1194083 RepID=A0A077M109_9MICO|nr:hypothetical protein [Tetrasphaera japonica]CCH77874.1 Hydroxylaminobenzene mutase [Tetrasphaera japonica T1-X7]